MQKLHFGICGAETTAYKAWANVSNATTDRPTDLTGYTAEWRDSNGNLITSTTVRNLLTAEGQIHPLIGTTMSTREQPRDLFDKPAKFLLYDNHTKGAHPTPTPTPVISPDLKQLEIKIDITNWERGETRKREGRYLRTQHAEWWGQDLYSGELEEGRHVTYDANGRKWHITQIRAIERNSFIEACTSTLYKLELKNYDRAVADFTGYRLEAVNEEGEIIGSGEWIEPEGYSQVIIGSTWFSGYNNEPDTKAVTLRLWDPLDPTLTPTPVP